MSDVAASYEIPLEIVVFFRIFIHYSCPQYLIFTKLSKILCLNNVAYLFKFSGKICLDQNGPYLNMIQKNISFKKCYSRLS